MSPELESALLGALVGSGIGVLGTYVFDVRKAIRTRKEAEDSEARARANERAAVATLLLEDLRDAEGSFRQLFESDQPSRSVVSRPRYYFDDVRTSLRWFDAKNIHAIQDFFRLAGQYFEGVRLLRESGKGYIASTPQREHQLRAQAGFVLQSIPAALSALLDSGAVLTDPTPQWDGVVFPNLPKVPPPAFAKTREWLRRKGRDATA